MTDQDNSNDTGNEPQSANRPPWPRKLRVGAEVVVQLPATVIMPPGTDVSETPGDARYRLPAGWYINVIANGIHMCIPANSIKEVTKSKKE